MFFLLLFLIPWSAAAAQLLPPGVELGAPVDVAPWGERTSWASGKDVGLWWEDPRDLHRIVVRFAQEPPPADSVRLQWWQSEWPERRVPRDQIAGAGESGWLHLGDLYQGKWRDADVYRDTKGKTWTYTFRHINGREFPDLRGFDAEYRTTMKIRLLFERPAPAIEAFQAFTDSTWKRIDVGVEWGGTADKAVETWDGCFEAFNGYVEQLQALDPPPALELVAGPNPAWKSRVHKRTARLNAVVWYTESPNPNTFDRTVITARTRQHTFSFDPADLAAGQTVFAPIYGVAVALRPDESATPTGHRASSAAGRASIYGDALAAWKQRREKPLYERVFDEPEQSLERATREQPPKKQFYIPLGTEGGRQRFGVNPDGSAFCQNDRIDQPAGKDTPRRTWGANRLDFSFGLPSQPEKRWIEDDCLPIIHATWLREGIRYTQTAFATRLDPGGLGFPDMQADDTTVLMVAIVVENVSDQETPAQIVLSLRGDGRPIELADRDGLVYARQGGQENLRAAFSIRQEASVTAEAGKLSFSGQMPANETATLVVRIPFVTLKGPAEIERLRQLSFAAELERVRSFWRTRADVGTRIQTPIPDINHFYRAHLSHLLINCGREVGSDRLMARVGSFSYGVYGNESCMMITDLDRRGYHREAERCLDTFLDYQGTVPLPGDYSSQRGVLNGANGWESGGYNQHHGWILWAMAEHYRYSGDRAWLERRAPKLLEACRWITHERARTKSLTGLRAIERGLLPPGSLEDIGDWRAWMSNNGFSWWGLDAIADVLADIRHPEAQALQAEADAYRRDILAAFTEAMARSPLVPLRDGTWIPQIPSEVHRRGRSFGWITVTLEGPIYFLRTGLMPPDHALAVPIMQDYEDNLYLSERYGYSWKKHGEYWFSRGGISMQPNLLCSPHPYLLRDEIKHYLRAYFNAFASCYYPDTRMMCEHPLPDLGDWRGDHYKSSDESNSTYWLRLMFVDERDDDLYLGMALPRAWLADGQRPAIENAATYFGHLSLRYESKAAQGQITAVLTPPTRQPPRHIYVRFRHPDGKPIRRVLIDGQPTKRFDVQREWVELPPTRPTRSRSGSTPAPERPAAPRTITVSY